MMESIAWRPVSAVDPLALVEARNQAHHALQIPAIAAIAFIPFRDDDSPINGNAYLMLESVRQDDVTIKPGPNEVRM
ncbi:MAG: hypothetical protein AAGA75_24045 [Cyanobacteria bacterium P01_E01_bin.6]